MQNNQVQNVNLTSHQKQVLIAIHMAPTPHTAAADLQGDEQLKAAADLLSDLGAIESNETGVTVTDVGISLMKDAALIDDSNQLTDDGMELARAIGGKEPPPEPQGDYPDDAQSQSDGEQEAELDVDLDLDLGESWTLVREVHKLID